MKAQTVERCWWRTGRLRHGASVPPPEEGQLCLPARFGDDHLRADVVEALPQIRALQLHLDLLHGERRRGVTGAGDQIGG